MGRRAQEALRTTGWIIAKRLWSTMQTMWSSGNRVLTAALASLTSWMSLYPTIAQRQTSQSDTITHQLPPWIPIARPWITGKVFPNGLLAIRAARISPNTRRTPCSKKSSRLQMKPKAWHSRNLFRWETWSERLVGKQPVKPLSSLEKKTIRTRLPPATRWAAYRRKQIWSSFGKRLTR